MDRLLLAAALFATFGLSLMAFRHWWVRERINYYRGIRDSWSGTHAGDKAERKLRWYETHQGEAERRAVYLGVACAFLGVVLLFLWMARGVIVQ